MDLIGQNISSLPDSCTQWSVVNSPYTTCSDTNPAMVGNKNVQTTVLTSMAWLIIYKAFIHIFCKAHDVDAKSNSHTHCYLQLVGNKFIHYRTGIMDRKQVAVRVALSSL